MAKTVANILTLRQHIWLYATCPELYRPECCHHCGKKGLWCYGCYWRKPDRRNRGQACQNPIPIPRFICPSCRRTMSVRPECVPPRRWYLYFMQRLVVVMSLCGYSHRKIERRLQLSRRTVGRWLQRLDMQFTLHKAIFSERHTELGEMANYEQFWRQLLSRYRLAQCMSYLETQNIAVP